MVCLVLAVIVTATACSRKKDGFTNKLYHQTTSQYNWYFNANEIWDIANNELWSSKEEDYLQILPVFVTPSDAQQELMLPQMDAIIEKCGTLIDRHSMEISKKEQNKWIDDSYLLIGKANFYKGRYSTAQEMFAYVSKKYKGQSSRFDAALWLARTYFETDQFAKASTVLSVIEKDKGDDKPKTFDADFNAVYADMYLRQGRYKDAIPYLEDAANYVTDKRYKARFTYIAGQAHQKEGRSAQAIKNFERVVELKPGYEMEFYAKISQALAFDRKLDSKKIKDMLRAMAREEKYKDFLDQIYYAWAEIELEERNIEEGLRLLKLSASSSTTNIQQKAKSYLRIADIYFADREYLVSKSYYDSTATMITEDFPGYYDILAKASSLGDLVTNLTTIETNDSLLNLATMDEKDREKTILKMIADLEAAFEEKKREEQAALERLQFASGSSGGDAASYGSGKNWYFYNPAAMGKGMQEFKRRWGPRKLEDNWRRSIKATVAADMRQNDPDAVAELGKSVDSGIKTLDEYLALLPMSDSAQASLHNEIILSLYDIGLIYKERLKDQDNAIESLLRITTQYDTSATAPSAFYQLYRIYFEKEQSGSFVGTGFKDNSDYYKDVILSDYPNSEYAKLILNPDYVSAKNANYEAEKLVYENTYKKFSQRQYNDVLVACNTVIAGEPNNNFLPKYYLIKAFTLSAKNDATTFENVLKDIIAKFPGTEEAEKAAELLGNLNDAKASRARADSGRELTTITPPDPSADAALKDDPADVNTSMFNVDDNSEHFFALIFPKEAENATALKEVIAQYNSEFFKNANLRVTNSFIDKDHQIVIVRSFKTKEESMEYYKAFNLNKSVLSELIAKNYPTFTITTKNFTVLFRNKNPEVYKVFFDANYQ